MGQRTQQFFRLPNPIPAYRKSLDLKNMAKWRNKIDELANTEASISKFEEIYGTRDHIIVAFHHQWLYSASMTISALQMLDFNASLINGKDYYNPFHKDYLNSHVSSNDINTPDALIAFLQNFISVFRDKLFAEYSRTGIERFHHLNPEEPEMRNAYDLGDNNDGIYIIDLETNKYCFVNNVNNDVEKTKFVDAHTYLQASYPDIKTPELVREYAEEDYYKGKELDIVLAKNAKNNAKIVKRFKKHKLLSTAEVSEMFPQMNILPQTKKLQLQTT